MLAKMDTDGSGTVEEGEFVKYFMGVLRPENDESFLRTVKDFLACAKGA